MRREFIAEKLQVSLRNWFEAPRLCIIAVSGQRPATDEVREPWIPIKYGPAVQDDWFGVVPATVEFERAPGVTAERLDLVVKVNPKRGLARTLIPWIIEHQKIALDRPYWEYRCAAETDRTSARELEVYSLAKSRPELSRVLPRCYGTAVDAAGEHALFLEFVTNAARLDASGAVADWPPDAIDGALKAATGWQAAFWNRLDQVSWAGPRPTTQDMIADVPLWQGPLDDARKRFPNIITDDVWRRRHALIDRLADWHPEHAALRALCLPSARKTNIQNVTLERRETTNERTGRTLRPTAHPLRTYCQLLRECLADLLRFSRSSFSVPTGT